jgi:hypothetical protein
LVPIVSVAWIVGLYEPAVVGVPDIWPAALSATPAGNWPEVTAHVYGAVPPDAVIDVVYGCATVAFGSADVVMERTAPTCIPRLLDVCCPVESFACTVKLYDAAVNGVPESVPESGVRLIPAGSCPDEIAQV